MKRRAFLTGVGGAGLSLSIGSITGCSAPSETGSTGGKTTISVMEMPPRNKEASRKAFLDKVAEFERQNPTIKIDPSETLWDAKSFAAKLAGRTSETVVNAPATETSIVIQRKQASDITKALQTILPDVKFDDWVLKFIQSEDKKIYAIPRSAYALGLIYNRDLFTKAGLDPDNPPATWDAVRAAADQISKKAKATGFSALTTNNGGGWHFTAAVYSFGGKIVEKQGDKYVAAINAEPAKKYLELLRAMRWSDNSAGTQQLRNHNDTLKDFASGKIGMWISHPDSYGNYLEQYGGKPENFGVGPHPQAGGNATLLGGGVSFVVATATDAQRDAGIKWIDFCYLKDQYDPETSAKFAKSAAADNAPVGIPRVSLFNEEITAAREAAIKPYVNVPIRNFAPFAEGTKSLTLEGEPPIASQDIYASLDATVQAILTRQDADVDDELTKASERITRILEREQK